jgi:hypothetical protein
MLRLATAAKPAEKVILDLRTAELALSWADWRTLLHEALRECSRHWRKGLLVPEANERQVWDYCQGMVAQAHTRLIFTSETRALDWAGLEALPQPLALVA